MVVYLGQLRPVDCPGCDGSGLVKTPESMAIEAVRMLITAAHHPNAVRVDIQVAEEVAIYLNNRKRREISQLEIDTEISVQIRGREGFAPEQIEISGFDKQEREVPFASL